jgi:hypothetical protein
MDLNCFPPLSKGTFEVNYSRKKLCKSNEACKERHHFPCYWSYHLQAVPEPKNYHGWFDEGVTYPHQAQIRISLPTQTNLEDLRKQTEGFYLVKSPSIATTDLGIYLGSHECISFSKIEYIAFKLAYFEPAIW